jgi:Leucine-rich repeat (LRR) protein
MTTAQLASLILATTTFVLGISDDLLASGKELKISAKNIQVLKHIADYPDLEVLSISCVEGLQAIPDTIGTLTKLKELTIGDDHGNGCSMNPLLPESLGNLRSLEKLVLWGAQDARGPHHRIGERHGFPRSMSQLKSVTYLELGGNGLGEIPEFVKDLPKLQEFGVEFNGLKELPAFLSTLRALATLRLEGNDLSDLPDSLSSLPKLAHITLGSNCKITQNDAKIKNLKGRFPRVTFVFEGEYDDCLE